MNDEQPAPTELSTIQMQSNQTTNEVSGLFFTIFFSSLIDCVEM
jgi:hypothetical protein